MNREMQVIRAVALQTDAVRDKAEGFGQRAAEAIGYVAGNRQIRGLENIADSALKVSDILDYIKRQTAKSNPSKSWRSNGFGADLLQFVSEDLGGRRDTIARQLSATEVERQRIHLLLIRGFVQQMAAQYAYAPLVRETRR